MTKPGNRAPGRWMEVLARRVVRRFYGALLLAYPRDFRRHAGEEVADVFVEACVESWRQGGVVAVCRRIGHALVEVPRHGFAERWATPAGLDASSRYGGPQRQGLPGSSPGGGIGGGGRLLPARRLSLATGIIADVRHAARSLAHRPAFTAVIVATLGLGIGANTAMFSVVDATLLRPLPYPDADRVVFVRQRPADGGSRRDPSVEELLGWAARIDAFERFEARSSRLVLVTGGAGATRVLMLETTVGFLDALGIAPLSGRFFGPDDARPDAPPVVVLAERFWRRRFGVDAGIVGTAITVDGIRRVVVGVAPDVAEDTPGSRHDLYGPLPLQGQAARDARARGVAWLKPGVSLEVARAQLQAVSTTVDESGSRWAGDLSPPTNDFWNIEEFRLTLLGLMAAVCLLLLIACVNVANLLLAAGHRRTGELAVRAALGASRTRLVRLLLAESALLALGGYAAGFWVAWAGVRIFPTLDPGLQMTRQLETLRLDGFVLGYAMLVTVITVVVFGLLPALRTATRDPAALQEAGGRVAGGSRRLGGALVAAETALSVILLISAALLGRAFLNMRLADPGFDADRVLTVQVALPEDLYPSAAQRESFFEDLVAGAANLPGVTTASLGYGAAPPTDMITLGEIEIDGRDEAPAEFMPFVSFVSPGYFDLMGIPLLAGRGFDAVDMRNAGSDAERPVVINRSLAGRFWPDVDPIGAGFRVSGQRGERRYRVVGVAADIRSNDLICTPDSVDCATHMYMPLVPERRWTEVLLRIAEGAPPPVAGLRGLIERLDPRVPADEDLQTAADSLHRYIRPQRFRAVLFATLAALAVALAALGISAVVFHSVSQRTREMGIRLALGARPADVRRLVITQGMTPVLVGIGLGGLAALAVTRTMVSFLYGLSPTDPATFLATAALLAGVAWIATWVPARRVTTVDPVLALRSG